MLDIVENILKHSTYKAVCYVSNREGEILLYYIDFKEYFTKYSTLTVKFMYRRSQMKINAKLKL
jgi:hypothetical protein